MIYGIVIRMAAFFRPILSAIMPDGTAPTIAPMANSEAIHVNWAVVARIVDSGVSIVDPVLPPIGAEFIDAVIFVIFVMIFAEFSESVESVELITSRSFTGDVHDRPVPAAAAPRQTVGQKKGDREKKNKQTTQKYIRQDTHIAM